MKVRELIAALSAVDPELDVVVSAYDYCDEPIIPDDAYVGRFGRREDGGERELATKPTKRDLRDEAEDGTTDVRSAFVIGVSP